jgi:uncharacterized protein YjbI with pentapeptide repeats
MSIYNEQKKSLIRLSLYDFSKEYFFRLITLSGIILANFIFIAFLIFSGFLYRHIVVSSLLIKIGSILTFSGAILFLTTLAYEFFADAYIDIKNTLTLIIVGLGIFFLLLDFTYPWLQEHPEVVISTAIIISVVMALLFSSSTDNNKYRNEFKEKRNREQLLAQLENQSKEFSKSFREIRYDLSEELDKKVLRNLEEKQLTKLFITSIKHLGNSKIEVRLGGIYTLEKVMNDSSIYYWVTIEILSAFIREKQLIKKTKVLKEGLEENIIPYFENDEKIRIDIQSAFKVLGRRKASRNVKDKMVDLSSINLANIKMQDFDFSYVDFSDSSLKSANFSTSKLVGSYFRGTNLSEVDFSNANLSSAFFGNANLSHANLSHANLCGTYFGNANLSHANLNHADLSRAFLRDADFSETNLDGANLSDADLSQCKDLTRKQLNSVTTNEKTKLPYNLK